MGGRELGMPTMTRRSRARMLSVLLLSSTCLSALAFAEAARAQTTSDAAAQEHAFNVPRGDLGTVLTAIARQGGQTISFDPVLVRGHQTGPVTGRMSIRAATQQALAGTGLQLSVTSGGVLTIRSSSAQSSGGGSADGSIMAPELDINAAAGANGSTDPTATEGTGSYTSNSLSIGSKTAQSIRETPQSVSVVTQQRIQEQNLTSVADALRQTTGITVTGGQITPSFYSRGFAIQNIQADGGAPLYTGTNGSNTVASLGEYDHVEVLRGADGLFNGTGDPGGSINLVRKRPLDHNQVVVEGNAGSWNNFSGSLDVTGPVPDSNGKVRSRVVLEHQDQHFFYDVAKANHTLLYGIVEADVTPSTLVTVGGSYLKQDSVPFLQGLPRYSNGIDLGLPRNTCLCVPWGQYNVENAELFGRVEQHIYDDWSVKLNVTDVHQASFEKAGYAFGAVNPVTQADMFSALGMRGSSQQTLLDATLNGKFDLFGRRHEVVVGADWQNVDNGGYTDYYPAVSYPAFNVFKFNPGAFPEPALPGASDSFPVLGQKQYGAYATLRLSITDPLHLIGGVRDTWYRNSLVQTILDPSSGRVLDRQSQFYQSNDVLTPYGGIVYDVTKEWSLYGSYTSIFTSQGLAMTAAHAVLPPVVGASYEAGAKGELLDHRLNAQISFFYIDRTNTAIQDLSVPFTHVGGLQCCYLASGEAISQGVDIELTGKILPDWQISTGYTYNDNYFKTGGTLSNGVSSTGTSIAPQAPKHLFKLWTTYQLPGQLSQWTLGFGVNAQSATFANGTIYTAFNANGTGVSGSSVPYQFVQGGYAVFNARVAYQIDKNWSAALNINNIFDRVYYQTVGVTSSGSLYGPPRNAMLTVRGTW